MPTQVGPVPSLVRRGAIAAAVLSVLSIGVTMNIVKNRPDTTVNSYIQTWGHSGSQLFGMNTNGNFYLSGSVIANGVTLSAGGISQTDGDARYVNTLGDTMTGALILNPTTPTAAGDLQVIGLLSGATLQDGGNQVSPFKCANFITSGTGVSLAVATGTFVDFSFPNFSGSIVSVRGFHQTAANGLTTYDVNINGTSTLSTKLTIDANERCTQAFGGCTDSAATPAVLTSPSTFNQFAQISVDVDTAYGDTLATKGVVSVCALPDPDGYAPY